VILCNSTWILMCIYLEIFFLRWLWLNY